MSFKSTMISLPKLMQHISNPTDNKSHHFDYTSVAARLKNIFWAHDNIQTLQKNHVRSQLPIPPSEQCIHKLPTQKNIQTQKNWLTVTMMKYQEKVQARTLQHQKIYVDRMDCRRSCCCGCKLENNDARKSGGRVCWNRLTILTILFFVSSVASSVPLPKT